MSDNSMIGVVDHHHIVCIKGKLVKVYCAHLESAESHFPTKEEVKKK